MIKAVEDLILTLKELWLSLCKDDLVEICANGTSHNFMASKIDHKN